MRGNEFLDKMELIDSAYVEAADVKPKKKNHVWIKWGAAAACFALVIYAGARLLPQDESGLSSDTSLLTISETTSTGYEGYTTDVVSEENTEQNSDTSLLTISETTTSTDYEEYTTDDVSEDNTEQNSDLPMLYISEGVSLGMGYEGYLAYDVSELVNANPWNENSELSVLPVYQNRLTYDENHIASGADFDKMEEFLLEIAGRFGLDTNNLTVTDNAPSEEAKQKTIEKFQRVGAVVPEGYFNPTKLMIEADGLEIEVDQSMTAKISFDPAVSLPAGYKFTHYADYDDIAAVAEYLKNEYRDFIGIDNPQVNIYGGDYDIYNRQSYSIEFFNADGSEREQIINYNFNQVAFYCGDEKGVSLARIYQPDLSDKVGDYPIISSEQAKELLLNGNYITTVPYDISGLEYVKPEYVKKVELIYRNGATEEYYMPYYRFLVELPESEREDGMKTYGAYYVPAVESSYISNMPIWDGSFNC